MIEGLVTKHPGPAAGPTPVIRSEQVAESDFLVSQAESEFPWI